MSQRKYKRGPYKRNPLKRRVQHVPLEACHYHRETARNQKILNLRDKGMSVIELARRFKISRTRVYDILDTQRRAPLELG